MEEATKPANRFAQKKFIVPILAVLLMASVAAAVVMYQKTSVDVTVNEALSQTALSASVTGFPGETHVVNFTVDNDAGVDLNTLVSWVEDLNDNGVTYTTDMNKTVVMTADSSNTVSVEFTFDEDTTIGTFNGTVIFERTA